MQQSFSPQESSFDLWTERIEFSGTLVGSVVYGTCYTSIFPYVSRSEANPSRNNNTGIHVCVVVIIFSVSKDSISTKLKTLLSCGVVLLFGFATIMLVCQARLLEIMWIDERDIPGGPIVWIGLQYTLTSGILALSTFVVASFVADSFLVSPLRLLSRVK